MSAANKKVGRHDRMMAALDSSSSDDEATAKATIKKPTIKPTANPIPTMGKKKAQEAAVAAFGANLRDDSDNDSNDSFDKPVMAKATPKNRNFKGYNPITPAAPAAAEKKPSPAAALIAAEQKKAAAEKIAKAAAAATGDDKAVATKKKDDAPQKKALFDDSDDEATNTNDDTTAIVNADDAAALGKKALAAIEGGITINRSYADRYDAVKRKQELQQLADKFKNDSYLEESDETDEEEDEDADAYNDEANDEMWAEVFYKLRQKDPSITDKSVGFFKSLEEKKAAAAAAEDSDDSDDDNAGGKKKHTLKQEYQRAIMGGEAYDDTALANIDEDHRQGHLKPRTAEEREAKKAFLSAIGDGADDDNDDLIVKKEGGKSSAEIYGDGKKKAAAKKKDGNKKHASVLAEAFATNPNATPEEQAQEAFLQSFFLNEKWKENDSGSEDGNTEFFAGSGINKKGMKKGDINWEQLAKEDEDEIFFDDAEQWEREFQEKQFQHEMVENPEDLQVKSFPRRGTLAAQAQKIAGTSGGSVTVTTLKSVHGEAEQTIQALTGGGDGLLRKHESTRAEQRKRKKERAEAAEAQRLEELKRLKTLKRMEIEEKRDMIARVAGFLKGGSTANTNDASLEDFNLENPFAANSTDPKDAKKKSKNKKDTPAVEGNAELLKQLAAVWSNEELEKDFDSADFDKKMQALFDNDDFNNDIDEEEIAKIRAEIEADDINFGEMGGDDEDDEGLDAEELAEKLLNEEVDVGYGDDADGEDGLFFANDDDEDADSDDGILKDDELFGGLEGVMTFDKKKDAKKDSSAAKKGITIEDEDLYGGAATAGGSNGMSGAVTEDDELTALLYPTTVMSKMEREAAKKAAKKEGGKKADGAHLTVDEKTKKGDLQSYLGELQKDLDTKVDEYNKLHYDKVLAGGIKTRFRYRSVNAENFGLTDEDILTKDDRTLNMIAPMRLYASYLGPKENKRDRQRCVSRIQNLRQLDPARRSRKYGDVSKTILFDPNASEEEGKALAARVRLASKKLIAANEAEEVAVEAEKDLKEIRKAKIEAKKKEKEAKEGGSSAASTSAAPKRAREEDGNSSSAAQPPFQRKPFEGRGGFRGGRGNAPSFSRGGRGGDFGGRGAGGRGNGNFSRGGAGRGGNFNNNRGGNFTPRGGRTN